jgi:hypothetical protein
MNSKRYDFIIDIINTLLGFLAAYPLLGIAILLITMDTGAVLGAFILLPAPVISYLIGRYLKHLWSFLALHVLMTAAYAFTTRNPFILTCYMIFLFLLLVISLNKRLQEEKFNKTNTSPYLLTTLAAMYFVNNYLGITALNGMLFLLVMVFILLYFLNMYLINFENFFKKHSSMADIPMKQIRTTNQLLILFFGCFCIIVMVFFTRLPLKGLLSAVGSILLSVLKFIFSLFPDSNKEAPPNENPNMEQATPPLGLPDAVPPSLILQYIENILLGLLTVAIIAGAIGLILYGLYRIYQLFYGKKYNELKDITEFISPFDKKERMRRGTRTVWGGRFLPNFSESNNDKIRKLFYKAVLLRQNKDIIVTKNLTPLQLSEYVLTGQIDKAGEKREAIQLALYYEKARYSGEECSKDEVIKVKNLLKKPLS